MARRSSISVARRAIANRWSSGVALVLPLGCRRKRTRTNTNPYNTKAIAVVRSECACGVSRPPHFDLLRTACAPTSTHSNGFCAIWVCISSSSSSRSECACGVSRRGCRVALMFLCVVFKATAGPQPLLGYKRAVTERLPPLLAQRRAVIARPPPLLASRCVQ